MTTNLPSQPRRINLGKQRIDENVQVVTLKSGLQALPRLTQHRRYSRVQSTGLETFYEWGYNLLRTAGVNTWATEKLFGSGQKKHAPKHLASTRDAGVIGRVPFREPAQGHIMTIHRKR